MSSPSADAANPPRRSVLLGLFIVLHLLFLVVNNFFGLLEDARSSVPSEQRATIEQIAPGWLEKKGQLWSFVDEASLLSQRWSQVTLQLQTWSLFAPGISKECAFPALLLSDTEHDSWPLEPGGNRTIDPALGRLVLSNNEPADLTSYVRWGNFRLRRYENSLVIYLRPWEDETPEATLTRWRDAIKEHLASKENEEMFRQYLRFRVAQIKPSTEPRQVALLMRRYALKDSEAGADFFDGPFMVPILRWRSRQGADLLDVFNPVTQHFEPLHP